MISKILVPVDGSEHSNKALRLACDLAKKYDADLDLLHIVEAPAGARVMVMGAASVPVEVSAEQLEAAGRQVMEEAVKLANDLGCANVSTDVEGGSPSRHILERARSQGADAIVMGSRGLSDVAGLLMGSVSHKVSHLAGCTCITVR